MKHFFSSVALFAACYLGTSSGVMAQSWTPVGSAGFSTGIGGNTDMVLSSNGTPYVAYQDGSQNNKATVSKFSGGAWTVVGNEGFSAGPVTMMDIALDGNTPYVAYADGTNNNKITVMKYDGATWATVGNINATAASAPPQIKIYNGTPYVVYSDDANSNKASVLTYNGTAWTIVGTAGFSAAQAMEPDMAIDASGTLYVVYSEAPMSFPNVKKYNGSSWVTVGNANFSNMASYAPRIAVGSNGTPFVTFQDGFNNYGATVMKLNGATWTNVGTAAFSGSNASDINIAIDGSNMPYVVYKLAPNYKANVKKYNGTSWVTVGAADFSAGAAGATKIAIDGSGVPYVVYTDGGNSYKATVMSFNGTPLPVTLVDFSAAAINTYNRLSWKVATETKGMQYGIERSVNGRDFVALDTRIATGSNSAYSYDDQYAPLGIAYYRLKMAEANGAYAYSKVAVVQRSSGIKSRLALYPVPAGSFCILENNVAALNGTIASVYNLQGAVVATFSVKEGEQKIDMAPWAAGVYSLRLADGTVLRLVKK